MKLKNTAALLISVCIALSSFTPFSAFAGIEPASYIFFDTEDGFALMNGAYIKDDSENKVLCLDGKGAYATINDTSKINSIENDFTVSVWFNPSKDNNWSRIFDIGTGTDKYIFLTQSSSFNPGKPRFVIKTNNAEQVIDSSRVCSIGKWNHLAVTRKNGITTIYLNGIAAGQTKNITYNFKDIGKTSLNYLGKSIYDADPYFDGMIDNFLVSDRAYDAEEIKAMAGETYNRELEIIKENNFTKNSALDINTTAYNENTNAKIETFSDSDNVLVKSNIKNYRDSDTQITVTSFKNNEKSMEKTVSLMSGEEFEFSETFSGADVNEYNISITDSLDNTTYDGGKIIKSNVIFPNESPADSAATTEGVHDPSIFKDPLSDYYYVYSSHNLIFRTKDLINWEKYNIIQNITVPDSCKNFIDNNYTGTSANGTYWAPDVIYTEDDEYPYWMYVSVSCGLGGRNSVIGLLKAKTAGFWLDGEVIDCGVVLASKEVSGYPTNAIDANIFKDSDGKNYFIWGSFWDGIRIAPLNSDGTVSGVDMTSDASILSSSKTVGTRIFTTPRGVVGPEGPWLINNPENNQRYLFTSYGWLGTNYNVRIARMSNEQTLDKDTVFKDYNNINVGTPNNSARELWGYKLIGSYKLGDGITYVGQGHNSVLHDEDGNWYLVDHCRKIEDGIAYLQVRKMLWTEDGWPVVSPLVYAGEIEQEIPRDMICGSYDLSSVGHTIMKNGVSASSGDAYKGSDLPVLSSEIVLQADGSVSNDIGTWEYDGDHTVTITFTKDGNEDNYEFYKNGDKMTLFVLTGYDKDKRENALVMTGKDEKGITQFAKKNNLSASTAMQYERKAPENTEETVIQKSPGGNPILGFDADGKRFYGGDPAAMADGDTVYLYVGHDTASGNSYVMPEWAVYSSKDMKNWKYENVVMKATDISWRNDNNSAWASQVIKHNNKYYLYFCTWDKTSDGKQSIGVAVSDSPTGPFADIGKPLIAGTVTEPQTSNWNDIDPTVWIEKDSDGIEHIYLAWGNGIYYLCELNDDMISVKDVNNDGKIDMEDIHGQTFTNMDGHSFTEAPWLYRRKDSSGNYYGNYYTFFASNWREEMSYAVSSDLASNTWEYKGVIMPQSATANTNHPSVIDFKGKTYFIYHNGALEKGSGYRRSVCVEEMSFDSDGNVKPIKETSVGLTGYSFRIENKDRLLNYDNFTNPTGDDGYPISKALKFSYIPEGDNTEWEILSGKSDNPANVSVQAVNKPGLYLCVSGDKIVLTQDADGKQAKNMTFRTVKGIDGKGGISFESIAKPGYFITSSADGLILTNGSYAPACEFNIVQTHCAEYGQILTEAKNITYNSGTVSADIQITNSGDTSFPFTEIAVLYDKDGAVKDTDIKYNARILENESVEREIIFNNAEEGDFFGYFVWDDISRNRPLCEKIYQKIN